MLALLCFCVATVFFGERRFILEMLAMMIFEGADVGEHIMSYTLTTVIIPALGNEYTPVNRPPRCVSDGSRPGETSTGAERGELKAVADARLTSVVKLLERNSVRPP